MTLWFVIFSHSLHLNNLIFVLFIRIRLIITIKIIFMWVYLIMLLCTQKKWIRNVNMREWHCYFVTQLFVGFWWIRWLENHLFLLWTIHESIEYHLNEILCLNKSVKKKTLVRDMSKFYMYGHIDLKRLGACPIYFLESPTKWYWTCKSFFE